jgi:hypothetical protein
MRYDVQGRITDKTGIALATLFISRKESCKKPGIKRMSVLFLLASETPF